MCYMVNSLAPGRSECDSKNGIFNPVLLIGILRSLYDNALRWMPQDITDDKSTLVQVMAWCGQATSQYLSQYWPRSNAATLKCVGNGDTAVLHLTIIMLDGALFFDIFSPQIQSKFGKFVSLLQFHF